MAEINIRAAEPHHRSLILDAFQRSYRKDNPYAQDCSPAIIIPKLDTLLDRGWIAFVASPDGRDDSILGFAVFRRPGRIAWIHTKRPYRMAGVARALWNAARLTEKEIETPFMTPFALKLAQKVGITLRFRPYIPEIEAFQAAQEAAANLAIPQPRPWEDGRLVRATFDDEANVERTTGDMVASIRRMLQWKLEGLERTCRTRPPTEEEAEKLVKWARQLLAIDKAIPKGGLEKPLSQMTDEELARKAGF